MRAQTGNSPIAQPFRHVVAVGFPVATTHAERLPRNAVQGLYSSNTPRAPVIGERQHLAVVAHECVAGRLDAGISPGASALRLGLHALDASSTIQARPNFCAFSAPASIRLFTRRGDPPKSAAASFVVSTGPPFPCIMVTLNIPNEEYFFR